MIGRKYKREKIYKKQQRKFKIFITLFIAVIFIICLPLGIKYFNLIKIKSSKSISTSVAVPDKNNKTLSSHSNNSNNNNSNNLISKNNSTQNINEKENLNNVKSTSNKNNECSVFADQALKRDGQKIAFLTFDDGPTRNITPKVLDVLKKYNVKATFFVLGQLAEQNGDILKREYKEGHSIGNHSYSHEYNIIYRDIPTFNNEVNKSNKIIKDKIGSDYKVELFRFPGGSFEKKKNPFKQQLNTEGIRYIDWNISSGDADAHNVPPEKILNNIKKGSQGKEHLVILMHDASTKGTTLKALPQVIEYLQSQGYVFKTLK